MLESLKAQGVTLPEAGEKKARPGTRVKPSKLKQQTSVEQGKHADDSSVASLGKLYVVVVEQPKPAENEAAAEEEDKPVEVEIVEKQEEKEPESEDDVKDAWDVDSSDEDSEETSPISG